ncbi:hypothetical protein IP90_02251 [Luteimonas cucumeris]|uniref:Autotransporter domain-containing protein n=1 Tax=Luteimonas cucumeris TaxID=985012 RepID=A0A562L241_9GAMM|nr:hypothetical protein [Luteimonas cucumeris]TWI01692.1 hypothetical protein IP90_02251 [Luteimonas cucumeris]
MRGSRKSHTIHVAPITRAIRAALTASAIALVGTGAVQAGDCGNLAQAQLIRCAAPDSASAPVVDLTTIAGGHAPSSVVSGQAIAAGTQPLQTLNITVVNNGTIGESGSGDVIGINADYAGAELSVVNNGEIYAESVDGIADGIFAYGADVTVNNSLQGVIEANGYTWAAGIEAQGDSVTVNNVGSISANATAYDTVNGIYGHAYGIYAAGGGDDGVVVNNRGSIEVSGPYATGIYAYGGGAGGITVTNRGDITATADNGFATGIKAVTNVEGSDIDVANRGSIEATGMNGASGIVAVASGTGSSASVNNTGDIYAATTVYYSTAEGIVASADGDASIRNSGTITVGYGDYAYGALAMSFAGDADVRNTGDITVNGGLSGYGVLAASQNGYADVSNAGSITVDSSFGTAAGINASSLAGSTVDNSGAITATANKYAFGVLANTSQGDTVVDNSGSISTDGKYSFGVLAQSGDGNATLYNSGAIAAVGKYAYGTTVASNYGDAAIFNAEDGSLSAYSGDLLAVGAFANANNDGNASIDNAGSISASGAGYAQLAYGAVVQVDAGDALVTNSGDISADNSYGSARGVIVRSSAGGDATVDNDGNIIVTATGTGEYLASDAIGVYVYVPGGTATVNNTGSIAVSSASGLADGVFAAGAVANVDNSGSISADGYTWGAGIEAQGDDAASVTNTGDISASATAYVVADPEAGTEGIYGHAYGIYASGGDGGVMVDNQGSIAATGPYATGVYAYGGGIGGAQVSNSGDITATADNGFATGIKAVTSVEYSDIAIENTESGSIVATGMNGASGIVALATGTGSSGTVENAGSIYAATTVYYSSAEGIVVSADGDANIGNSGTITIGYGDYAYGGLALAFAGDANVDNSGSVVVNGGFDAVGFAAASQNGYTNVTNDGMIETYARFGDAIGIDASSLAGTHVQNNGDIIATANKYAIGVLANTSQGDTVVENSGSISTDGKYSFGVLAQSGDGDATVYNTGLLAASGKYSYGALASSNYGDALISNAEGGSLSSYSGDLLAVGAFANANNDGNATIDNAGSIDAFGSGYAQIAYGAVVQVDAGDALVTNSGDITAENTYGAARGVIVRSSAGGDVGVDNSGSISAIATGSGVYEGYYGTYTINTDVIGVYAYAPGATATVTNSGAITVSTEAGLADGIFASGAAAYVDNSGSITADGYTWGAGIEAQGDDLAWVDNSGDISASAIAYAPADPEAGTEAVYGHAYGIYASGGDGGVYVRNTGTIAAVGPYATGIHSYGSGIGGIFVDNRGDVAATADNGIASGINAVTVAPGSDVEIANRGNIDASGYNAASGISVLAGGEDSGIEVSNAGSISAIASPDYKYGNAVGVAASGDGDVSIRNTAAGSIYASGAYAYGVLSLAFAGDSDVVNAGDITSNSTGSFYAFSYGVVSSSQNGTASATNTGSISATAGGLISVARGIDASGVDADVVNRGTIETDGKYSRGINAVASAGDVAVRNQGSIYASGKYTYGVAGISTDGDVRITNTADGVVDAYTSGAVAVGLLGISTYDDVEIVNAGSIASHGDYAGLSAGVYASSDNNDVSVINRGTIDASSLYGNAFGVLANIGSDDELSIDNRGDIFATSSAANAVGIDGSAEGGGDAVLRNRATIEATTSVGDAIGISGTAGGGGELTLANTANGSITATSVDGDAIGLYGVLTGSDVTVNNAGSITVSSTNGAADAIRIVDGAPLAPVNATIVNSGSITGAIVTGGGNDVISNLRGGVWQLAGTASNFGAGNNRFSNAGTIRVSGASTIDMTDGSAAALSAALAQPKGEASFSNNGVIDFLDGAADDSLTITGGFGGRGDINLDVGLSKQVNDQLFVQGGVGKGTLQRVNVMLLDGLPKSSDVGTELQLVHVSGGTSPSAFVAGKVLGISPRDFLSMGMNLSNQPDTTAAADGNGSSYLLSVETYVSGLNAAGVLASSAVLGVDSLMTSTIGNWRDRNYSLAAAGRQPALNNINLWVRGFRDESGMSPDHLSGNFGQLSNSRLSQDNYGTEMGVEYQALNGFRFGTLFAKSEGKQYLVDEHGMDTIRGNTLGLYGTWVSPLGFYVDASWRSMQFETNIDSIGGRQRSDGNATTTNLEAGYTWGLANGLNIEPQLRYTDTSIDGMSITGDQATFESQDAKWRRAHAGVSLSKTFGSASAWRWTPYSEFGVVRTFEGIANYAINDDFFGNVMTEGTSALVKFGLGAQKGRLSWNGGLNWMDGAGFDDAVGGQVSLQYAW